MSVRDQDFYGGCFWAPKPLPPAMSVQDQNCYGGCFQASKAFVGDMAGVRIWRRVLPKEEVRGEGGLGGGGGP